jgi:hypothetical protein
MGSESPPTVEQLELDDQHQINERPPDYDEWEDSAADEAAAAAAAAARFDQPSPLVQMPIELVPLITDALALADVARLRRSCFALATNAVPQNVDWPWLRAQVEAKSWTFASSGSVAGLNGTDMNGFRGRFQAMRWTHAQGCCNEETCKVAAWRGDLPMIIWLRKMDPPRPWDGTTCVTAEAEGRLEVLTWAWAGSAGSPGGCVGQFLRARMCETCDGSNVRGMVCVWHGVCVGVGQAAAHAVYGVCKRCPGDPAFGVSIIMQCIVYI